MRRNIDHYNLDMIIALGYRVQSPIAVRFRRWATQRLHEYIQKGFTMDDERLKQIPLYTESHHLIKNLIPCGRCGGSGYLPQYAHIEHGICFQCWGEGIEIGDENT